MRKLFLLLPLFLLLTSCGSTIFNPIKEKTVDVAANTYTDGFAFLFTCEGKEEIKADAMKWIPEKIKFLRSVEVQGDAALKIKKGFLKDLCVSQINAAIPDSIEGLTNLIKPEYKCTGDLIEGVGKTLAIKICDKIKL